MKNVSYVPLAIATIEDIHAATLRLIILAS